MPGEVSKKHPFFGDVLSLLPCDTRNIPKMNRGREGKGQEGGSILTMLLPSDLYENI